MTSELASKLTYAGSPFLAMHPTRLSNGKLLSSLDKCPNEIIGKHASALYCVYAQKGLYHKKLTENSPQHYLCVWQLCVRCKIVEVVSSGAPVPLHFHQQ